MKVLAQEALNILTSFHQIRLAKFNETFDETKQYSLEEMRSVLQSLKAIEIYNNIKL